MSQNNLSSIGDRVSPGSYTLHSAFTKAANFVLGERLVAVVTDEVGRGPVNLVVSGFEPSRAFSLEIDEDSIILNGETFPFDREKLYRSRIETGAVDSGRLEKNLAAFEKALIDFSPPKSLSFLLDPRRESAFTTTFEKEFVKRFKTGVELTLNASQPDSVVQDFSPANPVVQDFSPASPGGPEGPHYGTTPNGTLLNGIAKLRGLGFGLTPSGDDFIAGLLTALNLKELTTGTDLTEIKESVFGAAKGQNPLSNSFLSLARDGCFFERLKNLLLSLGSGDEDRVRASAKPLISHGETSGSDLGVGFLLTMQKTISSNFQASNFK